MKNLKNSFVVGFFFGLIFPLIAYFLTAYTELQQHIFSNKPIAIYIIAALVNLIFLRFSYRFGKDAFAKGMVLATFLAMLALIFGTDLKI